VTGLAFDLRWKAAAGLPVGSGSFYPTMLVGMRNRLRASGSHVKRIDYPDGSNVETNGTALIPGESISYIEFYPECST
jgi:hypothetical protein